MTTGTKQFLGDIIARAKIAGLACAISSGESPTCSWYCGAHSFSPQAEPVSRETMFDLASLTKVLTTHQWVLRLVSAGQLDLQAPVSNYISGAKKWLADCPIWRLSNHTSGLVAHLPFFGQSGPTVLDTGDFAREYDAIIGHILVQEPTYLPGSDQIYSDLGYMLLANICERVDAPFTEALPTLYGHGLNGIHWRPSQQFVSRGTQAGYAATEQCGWRNRLIQGEVHDDNCWSMGGLAGHAGSFGTLESVHRLSRAWLNALRDSDNALGISRDVLVSSLPPHFERPDSTRILGWDRTTQEGSSAGSKFSLLSPGHLGFTGTSVWLDVEQDVAVTVLTNRVCPSRQNQAIRWVRPTIHNHLRNGFQQCHTS